MKYPVLVACAGLLLTAPARADIPVVDLFSNAQRVIEAGKQLLEIKNEVQQTMNVFSSVAHMTSVNGIAQVLQNPMVRNAMPEAGQIGNMLSGSTSPSSLLNGAQGFLQRNQVYKPEGTDYTANAINCNATSLANIQAMAMQSVAALQARMSGLDELQSSIDSQPDVQAMAGIQARLASEQNFINTQAVQATQLQTLANLQAQVQQQASTQRARQAADSLFNATAAMP